MINYNEKEYENAIAFTGEYPRLPAGGYICKILGAKVEKSKKGNDMLVLALDICEGDYKDFFTKQYEERVKTATPEKPAKHPNNAILRAVLQGENWINRFKGIITAIENSNKNFDWKSCKGDETKLKGLIVGAIFREEEYEKFDGSIGTSVKIYQLRNADKIRNGEYTTPEIKKLPQKGEAFEDFINSVSSDNDDLPF